MSTATVQKSVAIGDLSFVGSVEKTEEGLITQDPVLNAATLGSLTTRTDDDTGVITAAGHSYLVDDRVDLFWSGGCSYGRKVTAKDADTLTVDTVVSEGGGDNLPTQDTAIYVCKRVAIDVDFDGDNMVFLGIHLANRGHILFVDSGEVTLLALELIAEEPRVWHSDDIGTTPITGNAVAQVYITCGEVATPTLKLGVLRNNAA